MDLIATPPRQCPRTPMTWRRISSALSAGPGLGPGQPVRLRRTIHGFFAQLSGESGNPPASWLSKRDIWPSWFFARGASTDGRRNIVRSIYHLHHNYGVFIPFKYEWLEERWFHLHVLKRMHVFLRKPKPRRGGRPRERVPSQKSRERLLEYNKKWARMPPVGTARPEPSPAPEPYLAPWRRVLPELGHVPHPAWVPPHRRIQPEVRDPSKCPKCLFTYQRTTNILSMRPVRVQGDTTPFQGRTPHILPEGGDSYYHMWAHAESGEFTSAQLREMGFTMNAHQAARCDSRYDYCHPRLCGCVPEPGKPYLYVTERGTISKRFALKPRAQ
jgi:hypothetical protein